MTPSEKKAAFNAERGRQLRKRKELQEELYQQIEQLIKAAELEIMSQLSSNPTDWQTWQLRKLKSEVDRLMRDLGLQSEVLVNDSANRTWQAGIDLIDKPLQAAAVEVVGVLPAINTQQLEAIRYFMVDKIKDITSDAAKAIGQQLGLAAMGALDLNKLRANIAKRLTDNADYRAQQVIQTELGRLYGTSTQARMEQAAEHVPALKKMWRKSNRRVPRLSHAAANNQVQPVDKPFIIGTVPMMHPHDPKAPASEVIKCGCMMLPHMDEWD